MLEINTVWMDDTDFFRFLSSAKEIKWFRPTTEANSKRSFLQSVLTDFPRYQIDEDGIQLESECRLSSLSAFEEFWQLVAKAEGAYGVFWVGLDVAVSGVEFDPDEDTDLKLTLGYQFIGSMLKLEIGSISPGYSDLHVRRELCNRLFNEASLGQDLTVTQVGDALELTSPTQRFTIVQGMFPQEARELCRSGAQLAKQESYSWTRDNTCELRVLGVDFETLRTSSLGLIRALGPDSVVRSNILITVDPEHYPRVKDILNDSSFGPWNVSFYATALYSIDNIEQAVAENDFFVLNNTAMRVPKVGEVNADIYYGDGKFKVHFYTDYKNERQRETLEQLIIGLADGVDIIDRDFED